MPSVEWTILQHQHTPVYSVILQTLAVTSFSFRIKSKLIKLCILSVIIQTENKAINIYGNFWAISILQNNKKFYTTCLQYSYSILLCFPFDIVYLPDGCKANAITFVLPTNNRLNVDSIIKTMENKLGFNRSYSKINNFSLMQSLDTSSTTDKTLTSLANKIQEMKYVCLA